MGREGGRGKKKKKKNQKVAKKGSKEKRGGGLSFLLPEVLNNSAMSSCVLGLTAH